MKRIISVVLLSMLLVSAGALCQNRHILRITTTSLPSGVQNTPYTATVTAYGGVQPYTWSISSGTLPPGLALAPNGTISGTPTTPGNFNFVVQVKDSGGLVAILKVTAKI